MDNFGLYGFGSGSGSYRVYTSQLDGFTLEEVTYFHKTGAFSVTGDPDEEQESDRETQTGKDLPLSSFIGPKGKKNRSASDQEVLKSQREPTFYDEVWEGDQTESGSLGEIYEYGTDLSESERKLKGSEEESTGGSTLKTRGKKKKRKKNKSSVSEANSSWDNNYPRIESTEEREIDLSRKYVRFSEPLSTEPDDSEIQFDAEESRGEVNDDGDIQMTDAA
ncbi:hypothetical protein TREMEDRAFT_59220 [Tremella mesenterica DSM 1558]|uniref:uncharacterized protein n=1 Tax=Tremella mesenterica (strain ATCC 24925 / CBS 8224 / DSM 1558 / NBRC 9311 / NRRL Y-6157 / RJB 2259-6 / UBC 559-6) TaxID=578456 RepID=UPI0003F4A39D|nr:uncharacterized protein TREMEDRAFT_59220 [Tremella mesenterica DSM 1558]EIW73057.1 hypothetical protein TREMEDRAFT_59220 [Tremella mesenterica DSM 1558]